MRLITRICDRAALWVPLLKGKSQEVWRDKVADGPGGPGVVSATDTGQRCAQTVNHRDCRETARTLGAGQGTNAASAAAGLHRGDRKLTVLSVSATALITSYLTDHTCVFKPVILCHHRDLWQGSMGPLLSTLDVSVFHWCLRMVAQRVQHFYTMLNKKVSTWHIKL